MMSNFNVPLLYRHILKAAKAFPSIKRDGIVKEIQLEFHNSKGLTDAAQVLTARQLAVDSLRQLEQYSGLDPKSSDWDIYLKGSCP